MSTNSYKGEIMSLRDKKPALLVIDVQKGFEDEAYWGGNRNNKNAEKICGEILQKWREHKLPVFHVRHSSLNPNSRLHPTHSGFEFSEYALPNKNETVITKQVNSAFIGTDLKQQLDNQNISTVVIIGLTTNHCISTSTRMSGNYGYETYLIADATATFDRVGINGEKYEAELMHQTTLASLNEEFARVITTKALLQAL